LEILTACINELRYNLSLAEELNYGKYSDLNALFSRTEELTKAYQRKVKDAPKGHRIKSGGK
jgi:hypothetical protein